MALPGAIWPLLLLRAGCRNMRKDARVVGRKGSIRTGPHSTGNGSFHAHMRNRNRAGGRIDSLGAHQRPLQALTAGVPSRCKPTHTARCGRRGLGSWLS